MPSDYEYLRDKSLSELREYMNSLPEKKGIILAYWLKDYTRFLKKEASFDPMQLVRYKRGSIVKVHLGYRVGSEQGGLHYAVVIDVDNAKSSPTSTIIPLTSVKPTTDLEHLHPSRLYIGNEIFELLRNKVLEEIDEASKVQIGLMKRIEENNSDTIDILAEGARSKLTEKRLVTEALSRELDALNRKISHCKKMGAEIQKMKPGSIALVGQITTISKIRIYDPLYPSDTLSNIHLSAETMDKLDDKLRELFTRPTENCTKS